MDFAEGTRLVRVVPDVPVGLPAAPISRRSPSSDAEGLPDAEELNTADRMDDDEVRNVVPTDGNPVDVLLSGDDGPYDAPRARRGGLDAYDDVDPDTQDTVVLGRLADGEAEDPRARIPAWEDIVFGVRRHR
jgi:hypothetical protein